MGFCETVLNTERWKKLKYRCDEIFIIGCFWSCQVTVMKMVLEWLFPSQLSKKQTRHVITWCYWMEYPWDVPTSTWRNDNVIITPKPRRDVVLTSQLRYHCVVCPLGCLYKNITAYNIQGIFLHHNIMPPLGTNFSKIRIKIKQLLFNKK